MVANLEEKEDEMIDCLDHNLRLIKVKKSLKQLLCTNQKTEVSPKRNLALTGAALADHCISQITPKSIPAYFESHFMSTNDPFPIGDFNYFFDNADPS